MRDDEGKSRPRAKAMRHKMTDAEALLWNQLREANRHGFKFRRQHPIGDYIADFAHLRGQLVIELDGETHSTVDELERDRRRTAFMSSRGWTVIRFRNVDVYENLSGVVGAITARLSPHPNAASRRSTSPASGRGNRAP
ncbi:MAG TPA: endonuclease domain-containing protein [Rhizomicrobium sp.]|nr:endonuclease domain-containing protein [Rhizomicrobium sp.]